VPFCLTCVTYIQAGKTTFTCAKRFTCINDGIEIIETRTISRLIFPFCRASCC
jgi:hypothetical protein